MVAGTPTMEDKGIHDAVSGGIRCRTGKLRINFWKTVVIRK